ncbi:MAG: alkaline phosphatase family protein [Terriglobales bacterium]
MSPTSLLSKVNHIVVVMLENRSFDHMLGFLYQSSNNVSPLGQPFEGLTGKETNLDANGKPATVFPIQPTDPNAYLRPGADPGEGYLNTNSQLFSQQDAPVPVTPASNNGFVTNFAYTLGWESKEPGQVVAGTQASQIMGIYTPATLPVLSKLASGYAVCDQWYASAPTETFPNRAFVSMATSQGFVQDKSCSVYTAPSIFTALGKKSASWAVYGYDAPALMRGSVADITNAPESNFGEFTDFQNAAKGGTLANYVFLEPMWGTQGNSQHPNYDVSKGEQFLHDVYYSLMGTPVWNQTLLIITYDEHGGCYDHVPPPENAVAPDNSAGELNFDFKRFGLRVPTVLVSPMIAAGTVFRTTSATPFDHTSILATVEARFGVPSLTKRDAAAPSVGAVLTLQALRTDDPLSGVKVPTSAVAPPLSAKPDKFEAAIAAHAADLPIYDPTGNGHHHETPIFATGEAAKAYARQRYEQYAEQRGFIKKKPRVA